MAKNTRQLRPSSSTDIDSFLQNVEKTPPAVIDGDRGRMIFAMDATASRQPAWDQAIKLQHDMFTRSSGVGELSVQLVYYRGMGECRATRWVDHADALVKAMLNVSCLAGTTQIERVLRHALRETNIQSVQALVFVGDCMEANIDVLGTLAGQLKLHSLPLFIFQEGRDSVAQRAFTQLASLSGGAHCQFDQSSAAQLSRLLNAVAAYAAGGKRALLRLSGHSQAAAQLLEQLK